MQTIIAAFDDRQTAQQAVERLVQQGFSRSAVHLQTGRDTTTGSVDTTPDADRGFFASIGDFFSDIFGNDSSDDAGSYAEAVRRGGAVVVVDVTTEAEEEQARTLLLQAGSIDMDERTAQWKSQGWTGYDADATAASTASFAGDRLATSGQTEQTVVPVVQEQLEIGKRTVAGGAVRVVKRVTETPVSELVRLRQERAVVERRAVDRPATEADFANFKEGTIEVQEVSEQAVVGKTARVVEEVVVGKEVTERTETVSDTVRRTDVEVERVAGDATATTAGTTATTAYTDTAATTGYTGTAGTTATTGAYGVNEDQVRGVSKQAEGEAKDAAGSATGSLGQKLEGKAEKLVGNVQEGYGNLKQDLTPDRKP